MRKKIQNSDLFTNHKLNHLAKHELFIKLYKPAEVSVHMERVSQLQTEGVSLGGSGSKPLGL